MRLHEIVNKIESIASEYPNVNAIVKSGDIFDLNNEEYQQKYSAICVTQNTHTIEEQFITYSFTIFYVDRLILDKTNRLDIQSAAVDFFQNLINRMREDIDIVDFEYGDVTTFEQRFSAECAGAYMTLRIITAVESFCSETINE